MNRFCHLFALLATVLFVGAVECTAQQLSISGTVDDTYGVVPAVSVTLRTQGGTLQKTMTDAQGRYMFGGLTSGSYEISVAREGFTSATRSVTLTTQSRTLDLTLTIAGIVTSVEVVDVAGKTTASRMDVPNREIPSPHYSRT